MSWHRGCVTPYFDSRPHFFFQLGYFKHRLAKAAPADYRLSLSTMDVHAHPHGDPPDTLGQILSAVCAVHCVTTPLFITLGPAFATVFGGAHPILLALVIGVAIWSFVPGYRCHRNLTVVALAAVGVSILAIAAFVLHGNLLMETVVSLVGAAFMMTAHWQNRKLLRHAHAQH